MNNPVTLLRRHIAEVLAPVRIVAPDCGSPGHLVSALRAENGEPVESLPERIRGQAAAADVPAPDGTLLFAAGQRITGRLLAGIRYHWEDHVRSVPVRSPRSCRAEGGVCARCYPAALGAPAGQRAAAAILEAWSAVKRNSEATGVLLRAFTGARPAKPSLLAAASGPVRYGRIARGRIEIFVGETFCGRIRYQPEDFWMPRPGQSVDAGEILEWGDEEWLADTLRCAGITAFHERFLARTQYWFRLAKARVSDANLEMWSRHLAIQLARGKAQRRHR